MENSKINGKSIKRFVINNNFVVAFIILLVVSALLSPNFLSVSNFNNLAKQQAAALLVAFGMLFTLTTGGIDLAVGANACLSGIVLGMAIVKWGWDGFGGLIGAMVLAVFVSCLVGSVSGVVIYCMHLPPFIVTLAMQFSLRGLSNMISNGQPIRALTETEAYKMLVSFSNPNAKFLGIPIPFVFVLIVAILLGFVLRKTSYGRMILATGSNEETVRLAGVNVLKYQISVYVISGFMCGIAGIMLSSRSNVFSPTAGTDYEMNALAGAVIGGASMTGGSGSVLGTIFGVFILAMLENVMNLMALPPYPQQVIKGIIIILAVFMQVITSRTKKE